MPNIMTVLNEQIRRLSRRETRNQTRTIKRLTSQYRRDIAALKRQVGSLTKMVSFLENQEKRRVSEQPAPQQIQGELEGVRFRADGLRSHRAKLGLSAADYGKLVGVSGLTIYHWENGKARPRRQQLAKLVQTRGIGKREAFKRLELLDGEGRTRKRGVYQQTAEEFVADLVKSKKATTTAQVNQAWRKAGRAGKADNTLTRMVQQGQLNRFKVKGERGSSYKIA